jgi:hypothetical protein
MVPGDDQNVRFQGQKLGQVLVHLLDSGYHAVKIAAIFGALGCLDVHIKNSASRHRNPAVQLGSIPM